MRKIACGRDSLPRFFVFFGSTVLASGEIVGSRTVTFYPVSLTALCEFSPSNETL